MGCENGYVETAQPADRAPDHSAVPDRSAAPDHGTAQERGTFGAPPEHGAVPDMSSGERTPKDMALSLLVMLVPIALLLGFYRVVLGGDDPVLVDPAPTVAQARTTNAFPVAEPVGLTKGWRTVSASFRRTDDGATLRVGYLSPDDAGVQLVQSSVPAERLLPAELAGGSQPQGSVEVAGGTWQRYSTRAGEQAFVLLEPNRTVIVVGSAREDDLRHLAAALR
jgi:hypothetical protein